MTNRLFLIAALATAAALAACGGGGSSSSDTGTGSGGSNSGNGGGSSSGGDVQTSVPASTYTAGSAEAAAFAALNTERDRCGFGLVAQSAKLDTAAGNHAAYLTTLMNANTAPTGHTEDAAGAGFTGATPDVRIAGTGYSYTSWGEDVTYYNLGTASVTTDAQYGNALLRNVMATVYHQASLLSGFRDIGLGVSYASSSTSYPEAVLVADLGTTTTMQNPTGVLTYPCNGSTNVQPYMLGESPNPFAGLGFEPDSSTGQPIYVRAASGSTITLTSATVTAANGTSIPVTLYETAQDPNGMLGTNEAFVIPRAGLAQGSTYTVTVNGTVDGSAFSRSFSFSTLTF